MIKDNIGMNARSMFVKPHYHGTGLLIVQFPTNENPGIYQFRKWSVEQTKQ